MVCYTTLTLLNNTPFPFTIDELFKDAQPLIRSVMDGYSVCILAYGQAGSGKTHTMVKYYSFSISDFV